MPCLFSEASEVANDSCIYGVVRIYSHSDWVETGGMETGRVQKSQRNSWKREKERRSKEEEILTCPSEAKSM